MNGDYERIDQHLDDALAEDAKEYDVVNTLWKNGLLTDAEMFEEVRGKRVSPHPQHRQFLTPSPTPLTSISDLLLSWSRGEWLIIDSHSYHPDFYINWRLRKLVGAVMRGKVYRAMGEDGEVYRVEGWESEHKEGGL